MMRDRSGRLRWGSIWRWILCLLLAAWGMHPKHLPMTQVEAFSSTKIRQPTALHRRQHRVSTFKHPAIISYSRIPSSTENQLDSLPLRIKHQEGLLTAALARFVSLFYAPSRIKRLWKLWPQSFSSSTALFLPAVLSSWTLQYSTPIRRALLCLFAVWFSKVSLLWVQAKRRQRMDDTSEWARYAKRPAARSRAIVRVLLEQALWWLITNKHVPWRCGRLRVRAGQRFATDLLRLGPLYIKLGQIISTRQHLLGPEWIAALERLQDRVPARTGEEALELVYATLPHGKQDFDQLFRKFDATPLAAASLGQVHVAQLQDNNATVAVKVQRPYLRQIYDQDFVLLTSIAKFMDRLPFPTKNVGGVQSNWTSIFAGAEAVLYREIDYRTEAEAGMRLCQDFGIDVGGRPTTPTALAKNGQALPSSADWLRLPYVYTNVSNEKLLVMEYVPSIKITNTAQLEAANITQADKFDLADSLARAYLRQFCCNRFFSTDPHPGNLGVEVEDGKPRLVMYDFGQSSSLTESQSEGILEIIKAIIDSDVEQSIVAFEKMGVLTDDADLDVVRAKVADNYKTGKVKANRKRLLRKGYKFKESSTTTNSTTSNTTTTDVDGAIMKYFTIPVEYNFVARALAQMDGVGKTLDPEFDFISNAAPYIVEIEGADKYIREEILKWIKNFQRKVLDFQESLQGYSFTKYEAASKKAKR